MEQQLISEGFHRIKKEDILRLKSYYHYMKDSYASSINLLSIFAWDKNLPAYYKEVDSFLWFVVYDKINERWVCLPPIGDYEKKELEMVFSKMESVFEKWNRPLIFTDITPWMVFYYKSYFTNRMEVRQEEELLEYIYPMDAFKNRLEEQRERYNYQYFLKKNNIRTVPLYVDLEGDCIKILEESFCNFHSCSECEYGCQKETLHNALLACDNQEVLGFILYADHIPVAYNIVSKEGKHLVFHFKKNKRGFRGINEFIHKQTVENFGEDCIGINYTEDMGVEGLRKYKRNLCTFSYQPKQEIRIMKR